MATASGPGLETVAVARFLQPLLPVDLTDGFVSRVRSSFAALLRFAPAIPQDGRLQQDFFLEKQNQTNWCWAAVGVAVNRFFGKPAVTQCALVQRTRQPAGLDCCQTPGADACNTTERISSALAAIGVPRLASPQQPQAPVGFGDIQHDIGRNRPIICALSGGGSNHFVVIVAWANVNGAPYVFVDDPAVGGRKERALSVLQGDFDGRRWVQTTRLQ